MYETCKEMIMAERALGIEAQMLNPNIKDGGKPVLRMTDIARFHDFAGAPCPTCDGSGTLDGQTPCKGCGGGRRIPIPMPNFPSDIYTENRNALCLASYDWATKEADVHVMHWKGDATTEGLKPLIFCAHGSYPEYCLSTEMFTPHMGSPFTGTLQRTKDADLTVAFTKRQEWFMKQLGLGDIRYVPFGIDLSRYRPRGSRVKDLKGKPICGYLEQWRDLKLPDTFIHAIKYASSYLPEIGMTIAGSEGGPWLMNKLATSLGVDERFTPAPSCIGHISYPEQFYRAFDIFFNPVITGESSRCGRESQACGTPAINYKTRPEWDVEPFFYRAELFDPISVGEGICKIWDEMQKNKKRVRAKARRMAMEAWDIRRTVTSFLALVQETVNRYDVDIGEYDVPPLPKPPKE